LVATRLGWGAIFSGTEVCISLTKKEVLMESGPGGASTF
jgi:hypothetical protein